MGCVVPINGKTESPRKVQEHSGLQHSRDAKIECSSTAPHTEEPAPLESAHIFRLTFPSKYNVSTTKQSKDTVITMLKGIHDLYALDPHVFSNGREGEVIRGTSFRLLLISLKYSY